MGALATQAELVYMGGLLADASSSYSVSYLLAAGVFAIGAVAALLLRGPHSEREVCEAGDHGNGSSVEAITMGATDRSGPLEGETTCSSGSTT